MKMPGKNRKNLCSPLVVSTDCSTFKSSYFSRHRPFFRSKSSHQHLPTNPLSNTSSTSPSRTTPTQKSLSSPPIPPYQKSIHDARAAAHECWRRVQRLELELVRLDKWLNAEKQLRDTLNNNKIETYSARFENGRSNMCCGGSEIMKLADGSYLHHFKTSALGRPCRNFAMQVSAPAIIPAEGRPNISQVLRQMASMGKNNLIRWLLESMPMHDISGMELKGRPIAPQTEEAILEAIFLNAVGKLTTLAMEGLKIQMSGREMVKKEETWKKIIEERVGECILQVMLIQLRNPEAGHEAAGEMMIGFVEACAADTEESGILIRAIHVAGISAKARDGNGREDYLWCVSMESCEGNCSSSSWKCERKPDTALP